MIDHTTDDEFTNSFCTKRQIESGNAMKHFCRHKDLPSRVKRALVMMKLLIFKISGFGGMRAKLVILADNKNV